MNDFNIANLPRKNFSDFAMSQDGRYLTVVSYLDLDASVENLLFDFGISDVDSFKYLSSSISGSLDRKNLLFSGMSELSNYICSGNYFSDGSVFSSWDYGRTWTLNSGLKPKNWVSVDMSSDGRIQAIVGRGLYKNVYDGDFIENTPTHAYISTDYGQTWNPSCSSRIWNGITVSPDGGYMLASDCYPQRDITKNNKPPILKHNILASSNTGVGWEIKYKKNIIDYYLNTDFDYYRNLTRESAAKSVISYEYSYFGRKQAKLSSSGRYQLITSPINGVMTNDNFGKDSFSRLNPSRIDSLVNNVDYTIQAGTGTDPFASTTSTSSIGRIFRKLLPICCDMSTNGQYQIVAGQGFRGETGFDEINARTGLSAVSNFLSSCDEFSFVNPDVYISSNYGSGWSPVSGLPKGLFCHSVSISDNAQYIGILGKPNSRQFRSPDGTGRYGSAERYGSWANFLSGNRDGDNLIFYFSANSGATWNVQERRDKDFSGISTYSYFLSQKPLGNLSLFSNGDHRYYFNYPECEYLSIPEKVSNWNSRVKLSNDGLRIAILDQGELLLSGFPVQTLSTPAKNTVSLNAGTRSWDLIRTGQNSIKDIQISNDGRCITYIVNSGNIYNLLTGQYPGLSTTLNYILYSGNYSGRVQDVSEYGFSALDSFRNGIIFSSRDSGVSWAQYTTPTFSGLFNHEIRSYGSIHPTVTGFFPANIGKLIMSSDGRYQTVFSDFFYGSGDYTTISQPDTTLVLSKRRLYSPVYYSSNSGQTWAIHNLETGPNGLFPKSACLSSDGSRQFLIGENYGTASFASLPIQNKIKRFDRRFLKRNGLLPLIRSLDNTTINYSLPNVSIYGMALYSSTDFGATWSRIFSGPTGIRFTSNVSTDNVIRDTFITATSGAIPLALYQDTLGPSGVNFANSRLESVTCSNDGLRVSVAAKHVVGQEEIAAEYNTNLLNVLNGSASNGFYGQDFDLSKDGQVLVIGASGSNTGRGTANVLEKISNIWTPTATFTGVSNSDLLGSSVSVDALGIKFVVGIPNSTNGGQSFAGRARVYQKEGQGWIQMGSDILGSAASDFLGYCVKINNAGNRVFIYSPAGGTLGGSFSPRLLVYRFDYENAVNWVQESFFDLPSNTASLYLNDKIEIDKTGDIIAIARPQYKVGGKTGVVNIFKRDDRSGIWTQYLNEIALSNTLSGNTSYRVSIKLSENGDKIAVIEQNIARVYFAGAGSWVQLGGDIVIASSGAFSGTLSADGRFIAFTDIYENQNRGKLYIYKYDDASNSWQLLPFVEAAGVVAGENFATGKILFNFNRNKIYLGVPQFNSVGRVYEYDVQDYSFLPKYKIDHPYSHGRFIATNAATNNWSFSPNPSVDFYGLIPAKAKIYDRQQSLLFKNLKFARNNTGVQIAVAETPFGHGNDGTMLGALNKYYKDKYISTVYLTRDSWTTSNAISAPGLINDVQISDDGQHISYLSEFNIYEYNQIHHFSENGSRYGIPVVSHDTGRSFIPILRWDQDVEARKACFIGNEWVADSWYFEQNNLSGFSNNSIADRSYDIGGTFYKLNTGYSFMNYFTKLGSGIITSSQFSSGIDSYKNSINNGNASISKANFATKDHLNTSLYNLRFSPNGMHGVCIENGQVTGNNVFIAGDLKEPYTVIREERDNTASLNNKIYLNNRYGDFQNASATYLNFPTKSLQDYFFFTGVNPIPTLMRLNNPIKAVGNLFKADYEKELYIKCDGDVFNLERVLDGQILYTYFGAPIYRNTIEPISISLKGQSYNLPVNQNLYVQDGLSMSSFYILPGTRLPSGTSFNIRTLSIDGVPTETGYFRCAIVPRYCSDSITGAPNYFGILITTGYVSGLDAKTNALFVSYQSGGQPLAGAAVKNANFTYPFADYLRSYSLLGTSGYGNLSLSPAPGTILTGSITGNYSGYFNILSFETGVLSGFVPENQSTFTWSLVNITGSGRVGSVYYDLITGYKNASNQVSINFNNITEGESLVIQQNYFTFTTDLSITGLDTAYFSDMQNLLFKINNGPVSSIVSGSLVGANTLQLNSRLSGSMGNDIIVERDIVNSNSIWFSSRRLTGGQDLRPPVPFWSGSFQTVYDTITKENSGVYYQTFTETPALRDVSGAIWNNAFNTNYTITTGLYKSSSPGFTASGLVPFNASQNRYVGSGTIPSGQDVPYSGVQIFINREKYIHSSNDLALYTVSGNNILYSGRINL
jgi:hypothetical protein